MTDSKKEQQHDRYVMEYFQSVAKVSHWEPEQLLKYEPMFLYPNDQFLKDFVYGVYDGMSFLTILILFLFSCA